MTGVRAARGGVAALMAATATVFGFGFALQVLALRTLADDDYATFVLALGVATVVSTVASAVQPVVAVRVVTGQRGYLPASPRVTLAFAALVTFGLAAALAAPVGPVAASLIASQIPLHLGAGALTGVLQGQGSFVWLAVANVVWAAARLGLAAAGLGAGLAASTALLYALPAALVFQVLVLVAAGAFAGLPAEGRTIERQNLVGEYASWGAFGWCLFGDAVYARLLLPAADAAQYSFALTLGRHGVYASAPLATILLPTAFSDVGVGRARQPIIAIAFAGLVTLGLFAVMGIQPDFAERLLTGETVRSNAMLLRGYALIGGLGAACTVLIPIVRGLGRMPAPAVWCVFASLSVGAAMALGGSTGQLLGVQAAVVSLVVSVLAWRASRGNRRARREHTY